MPVATPRLLAAATIAALLAGCGAAPHAIAPRPLSLASTLATRDDSDHAAMNKIMRDVLTGMYAEVAATADKNHDGAVSKDEYALGRSADAVGLFFANFDGNKDGNVTEAEATQALATDAPVEAYHHFTEEQMEKAIDPYMADKNFNAQDLRSYLTKDLGLTGDWPQIFKLMDKLDLNKNGKLLDAKGEGPAFMLTFARAQLQKAVGLKLTPVGR